MIQTRIQFGKNRMNRWVFALQIVVTCLKASASLGDQTDPFSNQMPESPNLAAPTRGSLAGEFGATNWDASDLTRGVYSLPLVLEFPKVRGPMIYPIQPTYSPSSGVSEWGMGISVELAIRRFREVGEIDFKEDELLSPFGKLKKGSDGDYYPLGLKSHVRVRFVSPTELHAFLEDGDELVFGRDTVLKTSRGEYACIS